MNRSRKNRNRSRARSTTLAAGLAVALAILALRGEARACGGLFCDGPPANPFAPLPVAQNGENVVFAITKDPAGGAPTIDAHIQILYTGDAAKFSWVVPVEAVPTLSTGTDRLFSALAGVTQPSYIPQYQTSGTCLPEPYQPPVYDGASDSFGTGSAGTGGSTMGGGVTVAFQGAVGPFDAAVIQSTDPMALKQWLSDNGYVVSDAAGALIDTYVRENKYFVALKLLNGVGVSAIQPIVLTFRGTEACVPLRLTAIAANPDMPVLVWVLADKRVVPRGFYEISIDEARIDWWNNGASYFGPKGLVGQAADEAGGDAFIAEYAGPSTIASGQVYANGQIDLTVLKGAATPPVYVQDLVSMGLASDPLMLGLLHMFIPMPDAVKAMGVTDVQFYGNLSFYWGQFAFPAFDLAGLTDAINTKIVMPRLEAQSMIDAHPYLTRLNTYLSPVEMTQDAFFFESPALPDVPSQHTAIIRTVCGNQEYMSCNAPMRLELTDGRMLWLRSGSKAATCQGAALGTDGLKSLPATQIAWQRESTGPDTVIIDNTAKIQTSIDAYNKTFSVAQAMSPIPTSGVAGAGGSGTGGSGGVGRLGGASSGGGWGCSVGGGGAVPLSLLGLAGAWRLLARARRRRRD